MRFSKQEPGWCLTVGLTLSLAALTAVSEGRLEVGPPASHRSLGSMKAPELQGSSQSQSPSGPWLLVGLPKAEEDAAGRVACWVRLRVVSSSALLHSGVLERARAAGTARQGGERGQTAATPPSQRESG